MIALPLLDGITALAEQGYDSALATHVSCTGNDKVGLAALDESLNLRYPPAVSLGDNPIRKSRKLLKGIVQDTRQRICVTAPPGIEQISGTNIVPAQINEMDQ